jgi:hypothetical protein
VVSASVLPWHTGDCTVVPPDNMQSDGQFPQMSNDPLTPQKLRIQLAFALRGRPARACGIVGQRPENHGQAQHGNAASSPPGISKMDFVW